MTINSRTNDYRPLSPFPNALLEYPLGAAPADISGVTFRNELREIVRKLCTTYSEWTLALEVNSMGRVDKVRIYQDGEQLGWIEAYYSYYQIGGSRVAASLRKRNTKKTEDPKKVVKIAKDFFVASSPSEIVTNAVQAVSSFQTDRNWRAVQATATQMKTFFPLLALVMEKYPHEFRTLLEAASEQAPSDVRVAGLSSHDKMTATAGEYRLAMTMCFLHQHNRGAVYKTYGDRYLRSGPAGYEGKFGEELVVVPSELPEDTRTKLGLLKLAPADTMIDGVGFTLKNGIYFVLD